MKPTTYHPAHTICARPSPGKGLGVFATRKIRAGEVIEEAPVLVVPKEQVAALGESFLGHYLFKSDNGRHLVLGLGYVSLINHGAEPNAEFYIANDRITVKALRAITVGAEVTVDYRWTAKEWSEVGVAYPPK